MFPQEYLNELLASIAKMKVRGDRDSRPKDEIEKKILRYPSFRLVDEGYIVLRYAEDAVKGLRLRYRDAGCFYSCITSDKKGFLQDYLFIQFNYFREADKISDIVIRDVRRGECLFDSETGMQPSEEVIARIERIELELARFYDSLDKVIERRRLMGLSKGEVKRHLSAAKRSAQGKFEREGALRGIEGKLVYSREKEIEMLRQEALELSEEAIEKARGIRENAVKSAKLIWDVKERRRFLADAEREALRVEASALENRALMEIRISKMEGRPLPVQAEYDARQLDARLKEVRQRLDARLRNEGSAKKRRRLLREGADEVDALKRKAHNIRQKAGLLRRNRVG